MREKWKYQVPGIPDSYFIRGKVPMTKEEVRAVTLSKLRIEKDFKVLDMGAGTGSISIEAALQASEGCVYAIEKNQEGVSLILANKEAFGIDNLAIFEGLAPEACPDGIVFDRVFIGGSSGKMNAMLLWCRERLSDQGRVVVNTITVENTYRAIEAFKDLNYKNIDVAQVQVSKGRFVGSVTMMESNNPVFIISADI